MPWLPDLHTPEEDRHFFSGVVASNDVLLAQIAGETVGVAAVRPGWLDHLYVVPEHCGRGIGSMLLSKIRMNASGPLRLWVFQRNIGGRRFYVRHGAVLIRDTDGRENEEREPDAEYELPAASESE